MSNLFEDYREIHNVRNQLDMLIELVSSAPRRVFLTELGEVKAILIGPSDYKDLWNIEFERDMKIGDEEEERGEVYSTEEVMNRLDAIEQECRANRK